MTDGRLYRSYDDSVTSAALPAERPTQRGMLCVWGFFGFLIMGVALTASDVEATTWPVIVFLLSIVSMMGTSALYHRIDWSPRWYPRVRRFDHAMIFVLITGTETPLFVIALEGRGLEPLFYALLGVAGIGFAVTMFWIKAPKWVRAVIYVVIGWSPGLAMGHLVDALGWDGVGLLLLGGVIYSVGALAYGLKRPDPWPGRFGYHEIFHLCVILAAATHVVVVAFWVMP